MYIKLRVDVYSNSKMMLSLLVDPVLRFSSAPSLVKSTCVLAGKEQEQQRRGEGGGEHAEVRREEEQRERWNVFLMEGDRAEGRIITPRTFPCSFTLTCAQTPRHPSHQSVPVFNYEVICPCFLSLI